MARRMIPSPTISSLKVPKFIPMLFQWLKWSAVVTEWLEDA